jgi:hypothetical protein
MSVSTVGVETNPSSIRICPTDICFATWWYYADGVDTDVKNGCFRMLDWLVSTHPSKQNIGRQRLSTKWLSAVLNVVNFLTLLGISIKTSSKANHEFGIGPQTSGPDVYQFVQTRQAWGRLWRRGHRLRRQRLEPAPSSGSSPSY